MRNMFKNIGFTIVALFVFTGCSTWSTSNVQMAKTTKVQEVTVKDKIIITEGDITDKKYKTLAELEVDVNKTTIFHKDPTKEAVNEKLKEEASKIGADAVIFVRYGTVGISMFSWGSLNGKGRAIKFVQ